MYAVVPGGSAPDGLGDFGGEGGVEGFEGGYCGGGARHGADEGEVPCPEGEVGDEEGAGVGVFGAEGGRGLSGVGPCCAEGLVAEVEGEDCGGGRGGGGC